MQEELDRLAQAHGILPGYVSEAGDYRGVSDRAKRGVLAAMGVAANSEEEVAASLLSAPVSVSLDVPAASMPCFVPDWLKRSRVWGITCQLYGLRSEQNWGIGDLEDLARLAECAGAHGADFLGVNPLHALFLADPSRRSPYSPSSRRFLNPLYIAVDKIGTSSCASAAAVEVARATNLVDYVGVGEIKRAALATCFAEFQRDHLGHGTVSARAFEDFCRLQGDTLESFACFEALSAALVERGLSCGWHGWPDHYKSPSDAGVLRFTRDNAASVLFHKWLQWVADCQLAEAQRRARAAGMRIGLYLDLAVGVAADGADTWADRHTMVSDVHIGAPPDPFNMLGQDWSLCPLSPAALREQGGRTIAAILCQLMRHAGAVRIDHVMGLDRLYWIPLGLTAADGAYVSYPGELLKHRLASASQDHSTLVIGEDLGTVPAGFREAMRQREIQGYRVFFFERGEGGEFREPAAYARETLACISTHDLPTLRGWWTDMDICERERLGLVDAASAQFQCEERARDRVRLLRALKQADLLAGEPASGLAVASVPAELSDDILIALHAFLARAPSRLVAIQIEDLIAMEAQANLPGTIDEHPNWRRKLPVNLEEISECETFKRVVHVVSAERRRAS